VEDFVLSQHAKEQMDLRGISLADVELTLREPLDETKEANGLTVFQRLFSNVEGQHYLLRVFVNKEANPAKIVTAYKTSKILKYGS
jgi:hypothetical protein